MEQKEHDVILSVRDLNVKFTLRGRTLHAIRGVSLDLYQGESLAIVGESGSGKSVFTKTFMGLTDQNGAIESGTIQYQNGMDLAQLRTEKEWQAIRGKEIAMVLQDPMTSLNPLKTIGKQIEEAVVLHQGLKGEAARKVVLETLTHVGIDDPERRYKQYPHEFSGGMRQRVVIAIAIACRPKILICDEPTTALDVTIQAQILDLIREMNEELHSSVLFITHDLGVVSELCDTVIVMYTGHIVEQAPAGELFRDPKHPYTIGLLNAIPVITKDRKPLSTIEGMVPNPTERIKGCSFWPRCPHATERCRTVSPPMKQLSEERKVRCWLFEYQAAGKEA